MKPVKLSFSTTIAEKFFFEKSLELLNNETIDSYRLRLHNPKTLLLELRQVIIDLENGKLRNKTYSDTLIEETQRILNEEMELDFVSIKKEFIEHLLTRQKRDDKQISYAISLLINDNKNYLTKLSELIIEEINRINHLQNFEILELKKLNRLINYFLIEIKSIGYSKTYLHRFVRNIFNHDSITNFEDAFNAIKSLITREQEEFTIVIGVYLPGNLQNKINIISSELVELGKSETAEIISNSNNYIEDFFKNDKVAFYKILCKAPDYYSATNNIRDKVYRIFDILHMGHSNEKIRIQSRCAVIGSVQPRRARVQNFHFMLDGYLKSHQTSYETFLKKISDLDNRSIDENSINKIYSGMRYLRLGSEAIELENKLLNYWIGIEYIFSIYDADSHTVTRLRNYYKKCHAYIYLKRILYNFHKDISNMKQESSITGYNVNLLYLKNDGTFVSLIDMFGNFPLLAYRAYTLREHISKPKIIIGTIEKHQQNLDWNLNRIYRIRNEIVHNAGNNMPIEIVVSHLRYYLVFILNSIIDYFLNNPFDANKDESLTLDDFFIMREVQVNNLTHNGKLAFDDIVVMNNPTEYLS